MITTWIWICFVAFLLSPAPLIYSGLFSSPSSYLTSTNAPSLYVGDVVVYGGVEGVRESFGESYLQCASVRYTQAQLSTTTPSRMECFGFVTPSSPALSSRALQENGKVEF